MREPNDGSAEKGRAGGTRKDHDDDYFPQPCNEVDTTLRLHGNCGTHAQQDAVVGRSLSVLRESKETISAASDRQGGRRVLMPYLVRRKRGRKLESAQT